MQFRKVIIPVALLSCLIALSGPTQTALAATTAHKICSDCHEADNRLKNENIIELCTSCHPANVGDHKVGVVLRVLPVGLPLGTNNEVICITCHEPHGKGDINKLLRKSMTDVCQSCHQK